MRCVPSFQLNLTALTASSSGQMGVRSLHRSLLQCALLWGLLAVHVRGCPDACSKCSRPEKDQCEECKAGWTLHNKTCVGTVLRVSHISHEIIVCAWDKTLNVHMFWFVSDIDECGTELDNCSPNGYCFNTEGSFECRGQCHRDVMIKLKCRIPFFFGRLCNLSSNYRWKRSLLFYSGTFTVF